MKTKALGERAMAREFDGHKGGNVALSWCGGVVLVTFMVLTSFSCKRQPPGSERGEAVEANVTGPSDAQLAELTVSGFPDLAVCNRVEISYCPSVWNHIGAVSYETEMLSPEESAYLRAEQPFVVEDADYVRALARALISATYDGPVEGTVRTKQVVKVACYHDDERLGGFLVFGRYRIHTEYRQRFECPKETDVPALLYPARMKALAKRIDCARQLDRLHDIRRLFSSSGGPYPASNRWGDALIAARRKKGLRQDEAQMGFVCPAAGPGKCHYAMNDDCRWDSPYDTVLLFETRAGWNRHGGWELFTFDNHDPKGGCVLLNDGAVKFIRTEAVLHALRWK